MKGSELWRRLQTDLGKALCHQPCRKLLDSPSSWVISALLVLVKPYKSFEGKHLDHLDALDPPDPRISGCGLGQRTEMGLEMFESKQRSVQERSDSCCVWKSQLWNGVSAAADVLLFDSQGMSLELWAWQWKTD